MKLQEIIETKIKILSEKKGKDGSETMQILAPWIVAGRKNLNGRLYPLSLLQKEVARVQPNIKSRSMIGSADHPSGTLTTLGDASHIITKLEIDSHGKGWMEATILPTTKGKNVMTIIKAGGQLGISARGAGTVSPNGTIESDYKLLGIDLCTSPSEPEAVFNKANVFESLGFDEDKNMKGKMCGLTEKFVEAMIESVYGLHIDEGIFSGSLEEFKKEKEAIIRAEILVAEKHFETIEQALEHLGEFEEIKRISSDPVQKRVTPKDVLEEALLAGVDPAEYAKIINANVDKEKLTGAERLARREAEFSGGTKLVEREEIYPDGKKRRIWVSERPTPQQQMEKVKEGMKSQREILTEDDAFVKHAVSKGLKEETAKLLWEKIESERKKSGKIQSQLLEREQSGFGTEARPEVRKRSLKILEKENK